MCVCVHVNVLVLLRVCACVAALLSPPALTAVATALDRTLAGLSAPGRRHPDEGGLRYQPLSRHHGQARALHVRPASWCCFRFLFLCLVGLFGSVEFSSKLFGLVWLGSVRFGKFIAKSGASPTLLLVNAL